MRSAGRTTRTCPAPASRRGSSSRTEDAATSLANAPDGALEFVFLDAERSAYPDYLGDLLRALAPGGVLAVDNVISYSHELEQFTSLVETIPALTQTVVAIGAGVRLAVRDRSEGA